MKKRLVSAIGFGKGKAAENKTLPMIFVAVSVILLAVVVEMLIRSPMFNIPVLVCGLSIFLVGFAVRTAGYVNLGKQFTLEVKRVPGHRLITTGVHAYIRHPMYTGLFMMLIGLCMALQSIAGIVATLVILVPVGMYRIKIEEEFLIKEFGSEYKRYMKKTKKLIPFVW
ncbi:isoprenylcysteine carboxylmethyltransferase family protein [archaeon]|nr:isoprenylcysteine carboxylmethyltransferase family protein [archaeon]